LVRLKELAQVVCLFVCFVCLFGLKNFCSEDENLVLDKFLILFVSIILSFWELLDIFPWYLFSGLFLQVVGRYQQQKQEQSLDLSKLKKVLGLNCGFKLGFKV
jgi:hypothetical protein